jgi:hypothetical protein
MKIIDKIARYSNGIFDTTITKKQHFFMTLIGIIMIILFSLLYILHISV